MAPSLVLLTGATGFIGRHLLARLAREDVEIVAVNRAGQGPLAGRAQWVACDLRDASAAADLVTMLRPSHVIHNAWMAVPGRFWTDPENLLWLEAGVAMLRAFRDAGGAHFTGVGTCAEYAMASGTFTEDATPIIPETLYGRSKAALWAAAQAFAAEGGFGAAWGRIFLPYGPGDSPQRLLPSVIAALRQGRRIPLSAGTQERDFIFAPDAADLLVRLSLGKHAGPFNVGTGRGTRVRDAVDRIAARLGRADLLDYGARPLPAHEPASLVADMAKVSATVGWRPLTTLEVGLDELLETP